MFSPAPGSIYRQRLWAEDRLAEVHVLVLKRHTTELHSGHFAVLITLPSGGIQHLDRYGFRFPPDVSYSDWRVA